jgi:phage baseplate assembly protein W
MATINRATRRFTDLNLLFSPHPYTRDVLTLKNEAAIKASVKNLVLTRNFERLFHPEIGCQVNSLLFQNLDNATLASIKYTIENVITQFEPRVTLTDVMVKDDSDVNAISIVITFLIGNTLQPVTVTTTLNRVR